VKPYRKIAYIHKVIVNASFLDESTLCVGDRAIHGRGKRESKHFDNNFGGCIDKANGSMDHF
jgi:hypothetical protein